MRVDPDAGPDRGASPRRSCGGLDEIERRVVAAIDRDRILTLLDRLVRVPSVDGRERAAQEIMAEAMAAAGMEVDVWEIDLPALRGHPAFCEEIVRDEALGVVGTLGTGGGPRLALNGHVDVVGIGDPDAWTVPPWETTLRDGEVLGRGTLDMKGALACAVEVVRALGDAGVRLGGRLSIQSVVGEEDGGTGTLATLARGHTADAAVVLEPTRMAIAPAQAGAMNFRIRLRGRAAHACMRAEGVSAIERLPAILAALRELETDRNERLRQPLFDHASIPFPISVGIVRGGEWPSTVPDRVEMEGRVGVAPGEALDAVRAELERAIGAVPADDAWWSSHPAEVEWWGGRFAPAAVEPSSDLVATLTEVCRDVRCAAPALEGMTYGSDMRLLVQEGGIPTVMFGAGDVRRAHAPDEGVAVAELEALARVLCVLACRFCRTTTGRS